MTIPPRAATARSTTRLTSAGLVTSPRTGSAVGAGRRSGATPTRGRPDGDEGADAAPHRGDRGRVRALLVHSELERQHLRDPARAEPERHPHGNTVDPVFTHAVRRAGQHTAL